MVPLATASILLHELGFLRKCRYDLRSTTAITDDSDSFSSVVHRVIPTSSVEHGTLECLHAWEFDIARKGDGANRRNENRSSSAELDASVEVFQVYLPLLFRLDPLAAEAFYSTVDMTTEVELVNSVLQV